MMLYQYNIPKIHPDINFLGFFPAGMSMYAELSKMEENLIFFSQIQKIHEVKG